MPWSPDVPFNELPPLPPAGLDLEPKPVLKATVEARTALATLAQAGQLLPNPNILIHAVPLLEAQASSEIENIVTTADELFKHVDSGGGDHATKEALRYRSALFAGVESIRNRPLTAATAARICSELQGREMAVRAVPGTRIANPTTREIVYAPPEGADLIREKLSAWERFVHAEDDLDPLVRMAVAHYQFEAIHPFHDGNGRTGRVINILMVIEAGSAARPDPLSLTRDHRPEERLLPTAASGDGRRRVDRLDPLHARRCPRVGNVNDAEDRIHPHVSGRHCRASSRCHSGWTRRTVLGRPVRAALLPHQHCRRPMRRLASDRVVVAARSGLRRASQRRQGRQGAPLRQPRVSGRADAP